MILLTIHPNIYTGIILFFSAVGFILGIIGFRHCFPGEYGERKEKHWKYKLMYLYLIIISIYIFAYSFSFFDCGC